MLSIIIPVYKRPQLLKLCLEGIYRNKSEQFEVIVVNDGGSADTQESAEGFKCKIINLPYRLGPAYARNIGAKEAEGETLVFVDSDILLPESTLGRLEGAFRSDSELCALSGIISKEAIFKDTFSRFMNSFMRYSFVSLKDNSPTICTALCAIRRTCFEEVGGFDERMRMPFADDPQFNKEVQRFYGSCEKNDFFRINLTTQSPST